MEAGNVFPTAGRLNWLAPGILTKARKMLAIDGKVKWEYAFLGQSPGIDDCLKETKLMERPT